MEYKVNAKVNIADLPNVNGKTVKEIFSSIITPEVTKNKLFKIRNLEVNITEVEDTDVMFINAEVLTNETSANDTSIRFIRRVMSESLTSLCEQELESVMYNIASLSVM